MAWAALTATEVKTRLSGPELTALQSSALASGQADPLPDVIAQVTDEIRGYIAAASRNTLGAAGTLPPQVRSAALAIVRWRLGGRLAVGSVGSMMQGESRRKEYEDALGLLKDIAASRFAVEQPETEGTEEIPSSESDYGSEEKLDF
ncbi:MAG TPA: phage protein Gp36 family protein [Verrucomicrobiae bacterium]|nr:phage protein Gp36 family protein [Verrucomicrobiae bacterium]